jgi:hypothetical protein
VPIAPHTVIETVAYLSKATKLMSEEERAAVVDMIANDPLVGDVIKASRGLRKARIPLEGRGKRGGGRVIYWFHSDQYPAALLWAFAKNERADLTKDQTTALAKMAASIISDLGG